MKKELQDKLYTDFPLLYKDHKKSMSQTAMCWGFECDDGWFDLIYETSDKLEKCIERIKQQTPYPHCITCNCAADKHYYYKSYAPGKCLAIHKVYSSLKFQPIPNDVWKKLLWYMNNKISRIINKIINVFTFEYRSCWCEEYDPNFPRMAQVKEKYGTLRLYLTHETDEMYKITIDAENKSGAICEVCGELGTIRGGGWVKTLCDTCNEK